MSARSRGNPTTGPRHKSRRCPRPNPFVLDNDSILDPDRLRDRDLDTGNQIGQQWARRETDDQTGSAGRGKQTDAVLPDRIKRHQRGEDRMQSTLAAGFGRLASCSAAFWISMAMDIDATYSRCI
jgi:hypothetical protein